MYSEAFYYITSIYAFKIVSFQQKHIDAIMKPAEKMRHRVAYSQDLKQLIDGR